MLRDVPDWGWVIIAVIVLYAGTAFQLHRLEKHLEAGFSLVREELALAAGNNERAKEIREEWRRERAKEKRALLLFLMITLGVFGAAAGFAWWWFNRQG
jgi:hypothetical protein